MHGDFESVAQKKPTPTIMYVWQLINLVMTIFFILAALANLNDWDWFIWMPIYLIPATLSGAVVLKPALTESNAWNMVAAVHLAVCGAYALYLVVLVIEVVSNAIQNPLQHEIGRELAGLLIIITWLGINRFSSIGRPNVKVTSQSMMSALILMSITLTILPLFLWSVCFVGDFHKRLGHCSGMF